MNEHVRAPDSHDDLAYLQATVPEYAGYEDEAARTATDQRVRAFVGSRLARLAETHRAQAAAETMERFDALILRCEFADQARIHELAHADLDGAAKAREIANDRALVESAESLHAIDPAAFDVAIASVDERLDARSARAYDPHPARS